MTADRDGTLGKGGKLLRVDRDEALREAEKLLRQGQLEPAIAYYERVVEEHLKDWSTANALGDVYVRAGKLDQGARHYTRLADQFLREGFLPKAAALYKKVLRIRPDDEDARLRLSDIASRQGLLVDARSHLSALVDFRLKRGDQRGAKEIIVQLGTLDPNDLDARMAAAHALVEVGDRATAIGRLDELADELTEQGRHGEALAALSEAARLDPDDKAAQARLLRARLEHGDIESAREHLTREAAGDDPELLLTFAEVELRAERFASTQLLLKQLAAMDHARRDQVMRLGWRLCAEDAAAAFLCAEAVADAAIASEE